VPRFRFAGLHAATAARGRFLEVSLPRAHSALALALALVLATAFVTALGGPFGTALGGPLATAFGEPFSIALTFAREGVALALAGERFGTEGGKLGLRLREPMIALATDEAAALLGGPLGCGGCCRGGAGGACDTTCRGGVGGCTAFPKPNLLLHVSRSAAEKLIPTSAVVAEGAAVEEEEGGAGSALHSSL